MTDRKGPGDPNFERKTGMHPALGAPYKPKPHGSDIAFPEMASDPYRSVADWLEQSKPRCDEPQYVLHVDASGKVDGMHFDGKTLHAPGAKADVKLTNLAELSVLAEAREAHKRLYGYVPDDGYEPRYVPIGEPTMPRSYHNTTTAYLFDKLNEGEARLQRMDDGMEPRADAAAVSAQQAHNKLIREQLIRALDGFTDADRKRVPPTDLVTACAMVASFIAVLLFSVGLSR